MKKQNKYIYYHVLQGYYSEAHHWEDLCQSESWKEVRDDIRAYRENAPEYRYRIIQRRKLRA